MFEKLILLMPLSVISNLSMKVIFVKKKNHTLCKKSFLIRKGFSASVVVDVRIVIPGVNL